MKKLLFTLILGLFLGGLGYSQTISVTLSNASSCYSNGGTISVSFSLSNWSTGGSFTRSITGGNGSWSVPSINTSNPNQTYTATYTMNALDTNSASFTANISVTRSSTTRTDNSIITINTRPGIDINPVSVNTCGSSTASFSVTATGDNLAYRWQVSTNNGTSWNNTSTSSPYTGYSTATLNISNVSGLNNYQYRCRVTCTGDCSSFNTTSTAATLTVNSASNGGSVSGGASVCTGTNSTTLSLSGYTGSIVRWQSSTNNWSSSTNISNTTNSLLVTNLSTTTRYRAVVQNGSCASDNSNDDVITINAASVGGSVTGGTTVCAGTNSTTLTLSGYTGSIVRWQSSTNNWSTSTNITNTTTTLTATNLTATTKFRAVVQSGVCSTANSAEATIDVDPASVGGSVTGGQTVCSGTNSTSLTLSGYTGSIVRWQSSTNNWSSSTNISNTTTTLTATNLTATTKFRAVIQNGVCSTANSADATITVDPVSVGGSVSGGQTVCSGTNSTTLTLSGHTGNVQYWQYSTDNWVTTTQVANTTTTLIASNLTATRKYRAIVQSGVCGSATSSDATVTVTTSQANITNQPQATSACVGAGASFSVQATGSGITYQWQMKTAAGSWGNLSNSTPYSGVTTSTLSISAVTLVMDGNLFRCETSSPCILLTNSAALTINTAPNTGNPSDATVCSTSNTSFTVSATGSGLTYKWQLSTNNGTNWNNISDAGVYSGSTTATLSITGATSGMNGYDYRCVVSGSCSPADVSSSANLTVTALPNISANTGDKTVCQGDGTTFGVTASGAGISYRWQLNNGSGFVNISSGGVYTNYTTATLTLSSTTLAMDGIDYRCVVSGTCSPSATSVSLNLTVNADVVIDNQPSNTSVCDGDNGSFSVTAHGAGLSYRWQIKNGSSSNYNNLSNGSAYSGTTTNTLILSNPGNSGDGNIYRCRITGTCSSLNTNDATLTINDVPSITQNPHYENNNGNPPCEDDASHIEIHATGTGLSYHWQLSTDNGSTFSNLSNGTTYSNVTTSQFYINHPTLLMIGYQYRCFVTGTCTPARTSTAITLNVWEDARIATQPIDAEICQGAGYSTSFTVSATGTGLSYHWQIQSYDQNHHHDEWNNLSNNTIFGGTQTNTLTIANATLSMDGDIYRCYIDGNCNNLHTVSVTLTVDPTSVGGSVAGSTTVCASGNSTQLVLSGHTGTIVNWESSTDNWLTTTNIANTSATYTVSNLTTTTKYRVFVKSGVCSTATSSEATITVDPISVGGAVNSNSDVCIEANSTTLVLSGHVGSVIRWESSTDNWVTTTSIANTTTTLTVTNITETTKYRAIVQSGVCSSATSSAATITIHQLPVVSFTGIFDDQHLCGDPILLTGGSPLGGTYSGTGVSYGMFDPSQAGPGDHTLTYTYTDEWSCSNSATNSITVMQPETSVYIIGDGADFVNLTGQDGLFAFLNANRRCGDVIAVILNDLTESGENGLDESIEVIPGYYALTIIPIDETTKLISGNCSQALIRLTGIDRLNIDGGIFWPYRALKFRNDNTINPALLIGNGVTNSMISSCEFESNNSDATSGVVVLESTLASNFGNMFYRNIVGNISGSSSSPANLFIAKGSSEFLNNNINMQGNEFRNYSSNGILIAPSGNGSNWTIYNNSFYATLPFSTNQIAINFIPGASSIGNNLKYNYVGGSTYQIYGSNFENTGGGTFKGISVNSGNSTISHNSVGNIKLSNTVSPTFTGIEILGGTATVNLTNVIGSANIPFSIVMAGTATFYGINSLSTSSVSVNGNTVANVSFSGNLGSPKAYCYYMKKGSVDQNKIFNIGGSLTTITPCIYGIFNEASAPGNTISNNMIALKGGSSANPKLFGIYDKSVGNAGSIIHNTVSIQGTAYSAATNATAAFYREGSASVILYNNILYNSKATTAYAKHYAIYSTTTTAINTNYNDLVTASPNLVYWAGTIYPNWSLWKTAARDFNSISIVPIFTSVTDLHLTAANVGIDNKGSAVNSMLYDIDGGPRSLLSPDMGCDEFGSIPAFMSPETIEDQVVEPTMTIYPNPVSSSAMIAVTLGEESQVSIRIYNIIGELMQTINEQTLPKGTRNFEFNSNNLNPGMYICHMIVNGEKLVIKRMEVIR